MKSVSSDVSCRGNCCFMFVSHQRSELLTCVPELSPLALVATISFLSGVLFFTVTICTSLTLVASIALASEPKLAYTIMYEFAICIVALSMRLSYHTSNGRICIGTSMHVNLCVSNLDSYHVCFFRYLSAGRCWCLQLIARFLLQHQTHSPRVTDADVDRMRLSTFVLHLRVRC